MTAKPYAPQSWSDNEPLFMEKLNAMTNNDQYLFENTPTVYYNGFGVRKTTGTKIMTGTVGIPKGSIGTSNTYYFGSFFSAGCHPIVLVSLNTYPHGRIHLVTRGIGTLWPDHRGFEVRAYADGITLAGSVIPPSVYAVFLAVGW